MNERKWVWVGNTRIVVSAVMIHPPPLTQRVRQVHLVGLSGLAQPLRLMRQQTPERKQSPCFVPRFQMQEKVSAELGMFCEDQDR